MILHQIFSVTATANTPEDSIYMVHVDITDINGHRYECEYASVPNDPFGLGPTIRMALGQWMASGRPIQPYVEPEG